MGKRLSKTVKALGWRRSTVVLAFLACLVIAGCTRGSDEEKRPGGGFYGGVSGGM